MSKSKGNVYYPTDLLAKGFSGDQLRFFLIYGPYRKKLNFKFERLAQRIQKLDSLRTWLQICKIRNQMDDIELQKNLTSIIVSDFENHMNNDLDVKSAFDKPIQTISQLYEMRQSLSSNDIKNVLNGLRKVDSVLQCIF